MGFDLLLTVRGLCALVPGEEIPDPPTTTPHTIPFLHIILLDVRQTPPIDGKNVCEHEPLLHVEPPVDKKIPLNGDEIEIITVDPAQPGVVLQTSYWSLASMRRLRPSFTVDNGLLATSPTRNDLVARVTVTSATKVSGIDPIGLSFATPTPYTGDFAQAVLLKIPIQGDSGSFKITSHKNNSSQIVSFSPESPGTPVRATLSNLCDPDHMLVDDADFLAFFNLEQNLSGPFIGPQPFVTSTSFAESGEVSGQATTAGGGTCIPART